MADLRLGSIKPVGADNVVVEGKYVKGGYVVVATTTDRDNLKGANGENIIKGSLCYCQADNKFYKYNGSAWVEATASSSTPGMMSATDKTNLDLIVNSFNNDDANTTIDTVKEVLKAFENAPEGTNIVNSLANKSDKGHTHDITVSGTTQATASGKVQAVTGYNSFSGGSGSLTSDDTAASGIKYVETVEHTPAALTGTKTFNTNAIKNVTVSASESSTAGPQYVESVTHSSPTLSGITQFNTNAIKSATLAEASNSEGLQYVTDITGTAPTLTGTTEFVTGYGSFSGGSGALTLQNTNNSSSTRIPVVSDITSEPAKASGTATVLTGVKSTGTATVVKSISGGSGSLTAYDTDSSGKRIPYVSSVTHTPATLTGDTSFVKTQGTFSAGTTPVSTAEFKGTSVNTGNNSGDGVTVLTGVKATGASTAAPANHTHSYDKTTGITLTANTSTDTGRIKYVQEITPGSGNLTSDTTATNGIAYIATAEHTAASLGTPDTSKVTSTDHTHSYTLGSLTGSNTTHTSKKMSFTAGTTPPASASPTTAPTATGASSGSTTDALTGVKATGSDQAIKTLTPGSGSLKSYTVSSGGTAETSTRIPYLTNVTHTGITLGTPTKSEVAAQGHTHSVTVNGTTGKNSGTGITAVNASVTGKKLVLSAVTAAPNEHTHSYGSASALTVNATSTAKVEAIIGYPNFSAGSVDLTTKYLEHSHTPTAAKDSVNVIGGVESTGTVPVLSANHTHNYDKTTGITLTPGTAPSMNFEATTGQSYVASMTNSSIGWSSSSANTGKSSEAGSGISAVTGYPNFSGGDAKYSTKYLHHTHTASSPTTRHLSAIPVSEPATSGKNSGTNISVISGVEANGTAVVAPNEHKHSVAAAGSITLTRGTAPSLGTPTMGTVDINGGDITPITKYLDHTHTAAAITSQADVSTGVAANGTATAVTGVSGGTAEPVMGYLDHTHTAASLGTPSKASVGIQNGNYSANKKRMKVTTSAADKGEVTLTGGGITPVTKYLQVTTTAADNGTVGISGGSIDVTEHYLHHSHTAASLGTASTTDVAAQGHTHSYSSTTTTGSDEDEA